MPSFFTVIEYSIVSPSVYALPFAGVFSIFLFTVSATLTFAVSTVASAVFSILSTFAVTVFVKLPFTISSSVIV